MRTLTGWQPARTPGRILAGNQHVLRASMRSLIRWQPGRPQGAHAFAYWLATSTSFRANMRSLTGWQRARLVGRRCVRRQTYADVFRRIQTYSDVFRRMQTYYCSQRIAPFGGSENLPVWESSETDPSKVCDFGENNSSYQFFFLIVFTERNATKNDGIIEGSLHMKVKKWSLTPSPPSQC